MRLDTIADDAAELATRIANELPARLVAMRSEMAGQPGAARYDSSNAGSHQWCWDHERDVAECHRDDLVCTGETFVLHDPTGEAAVGHDPASRDRRELERHLRAAHRGLDRVADILARYAPARPDIPRSGIGKCHDCPRYCDGTRDNRLSAYKGGDFICAACRARRDRMGQAAEPCKHPRQRWVDGITSCTVCGVVLEALDTTLIGTVAS